MHGKDPKAQQKIPYGQAIGDSSKEKLLFNRNKPQEEPGSRSHLPQLFGGEGTYTRICDPKHRGTTTCM